MICIIPSKSSEPRLWRWGGDNGPFVTERGLCFRAQCWVHGGQGSPQETTVLQAQLRVTEDPVFSAVEYSWETLS